MRIGIIQPLPGIGDMTWHVPAIKAIAATASDGKITLFAMKSAQAPALFAAEPAVAKVVPLPAGRSLTRNIANLWPMAQAIRRARLDRLFILHRSARYRLAAKLAGIRDIITYPPDLALSTKDGWVKSLALLDRLSIPVAERHSRLTATPESIAAVRQRFAACAQPWFIVAPGASEPVRRWPAERFAFCADALIDQGYGTVFVAGAPGEAECVAAVHRLGKHADKIKTLTDLPFDQFMGLITCSEGMLGNCSGPANIAATLGRPAFSLRVASHAPDHSPNMILIRPDLPDTGDMQSISAAHALTCMQNYFSALKKASYKRTMSQ